MCVNVVLGEMKNGIQVGVCMNSAFFLSSLGKCRIQICKQIIQQVHPVKVVSLYNHTDHLPNLYIQHCLLAPWQPPHHPAHGGEDSWDHSKDAREHPELHTTAYGTVDTSNLLEEQGDTDQMLKQQQSKDDDSSRNSHWHDSSPPAHRDETVFGHTKPKLHPFPRAPVKRDLNDI